MDNTLPGVLVAAALYGSLYHLRKSRLKRQELRSRAGREALLLLSWMFCGGMAILTPTPWGFHWVTLLRYGIISDQGAFFALGDINLVPFQTLELGHQTVYTVFHLMGNIIMFLPFGVFAALLWRGGGPRTSPLDSPPGVGIHQTLINRRTSA